MSLVMKRLFGVMRRLGGSRRPGLRGARPQRPAELGGEKRLQPCILKPCIGVWLWYELLAGS